ncbi:hypothetical protein U9M48_000450 [Paspalum notatum var. saurae]|uniref:Uncharacterized protein n=1 Tax=Paspalum notatum var. saurae TaxID=547442 RepID=A0AAQ3PMF2_PASNO
MAVAVHQEANNTAHPLHRHGTATEPPEGARSVASIVLDSNESSFMASSARQDCSDSVSSASEASAAPALDDAADDAIVRGIRSNRLLFDPGASAMSSILEEKSAARAPKRWMRRRRASGRPARQSGHMPCRRPSRVPAPPHAAPPAVPRTRAAACRAGGLVVVGRRPLQWPAPPSP